nr:integrase, catalytic region, zinc finger, CCHC-type, peptidase aspartic, catalytic [Tanacetum cinerariifolium]
MLLMQAQENGIVLDEGQLLFITGGQDNAVDEDVDEPSVQDLALNVDNVFQADDCNVFDSDVDEAPTPQTMFMANLSFAYPVYENNREVHLDYLKHLHESVATLREIVEEARAERPLDRSLAFSCLYTKHSQELLEYVDSTYPKDFRDRLRLKNFVKKFIGTVRFMADHFGAIMGYGDYVIGYIVISRVYYVEGLGYNLFSVRQFYDSDLDVAFKKHSCYVRDTDGVELIKCSCCSILYTISVKDMLKSSAICLFSKASNNKSWLWHRRLNHLNFGTINDLSIKDLVRGLPRLKFEKDHLCSACQLGNSKKHTHKPKTKNTIIEVLHTLHMGLCGPIGLQRINGKKYILVIVDDYSRKGYTIYNKRTQRIMETIHVQFDELSEPMAPSQNLIDKFCVIIDTDVSDSFVETDLYLLQKFDDELLSFIFRSQKLNLRLVPNPVPAAPYVPPTNKELEILFQPMFNLMNLGGAQLSGQRGRCNGYSKKDKNKGKTDKTKH